MRAKRINGLTVEQCVERRELFNKDDEREITRSIDELIEACREHAERDAPGYLLTYLDLCEVRNTLDGLYQLARSATGHLKTIKGVA